MCYSRDGGAITDVDPLPDSDFKSNLWSQGAGLVRQVLTSARKPKNLVVHRVQSRLLGQTPSSEKRMTSSVSADRIHEIANGTDGERRKKRSLSNGFRARLPSAGASSNGVEFAKTSPLRASFVRAPSKDTAVDDSDGDSSTRINRIEDSYRDDEDGSDATGEIDEDEDDSAAHDADRSSSAPLMETRPRAGSGGLKEVLANKLLKVTSRSSTKDTQQ